MGTSLNHKTKTSIELISGPEVTPDIITSIYELERDLWARFLGEYLLCSDCGKIMGKDDIYGEGNTYHRGIDITLHTVSELERILEVGEIVCICCGGNTSYIFGNELKQEIVSRIAFEEAYLVIQRGVCGKVLGFASAYVSDFSTIYEREFEHYYSALGQNTIRQNIEGILQDSIPEKLFCFAAIGNSPSTASLQNLLALFRCMFQSVEKKSPDLLGLYESVLGSMTHTILETCNTQRIYTNGQNIKNSNKNIKTDIFVHKNMASQGLETLGVDCRTYMRKYGERIRKIRE